MELPKGDASVYLKRFLASAWKPRITLALPSAALADHQQSQIIFSDDFVAGLHNSFEDKIQALFPPQAAQWHSFNRAQYLEINTLMSGYLLNSQGDRMLTQHSIEGRFPFWITA